jgi:hypothetical protein
VRALAVVLEHVVGEILAMGRGGRKLERERGANTARRVLRELAERALESPGSLGMAAEDLLDPRAFADEPRTLGGREVAAQEFETSATGRSRASNPSSERSAR